MDNIVNLDNLMREIEHDVPVDEERGEKLLTEGEIDAILGKPSPDMRIPKTRVIAWYDFASRFPGKLEPRHAGAVGVYAVAFCNYREVTKELDKMPAEVRYSSEFRDLWMRQKDFVAQMESAAKMLMGAKLGGRPRAKAQT